MDATERSAHTGDLLDEGDPAVKIVAAEKNVIEQRRKACDSGLRWPNGRRDERTCGEGEKSSAQVRSSRIPFGQRRPESQAFLRCSITFFSAGQMGGVMN